MYQYTIIVGNVGRKSEMRYLQNGTAVIDITVAVNKVFTDSNNQRQEKTTWFKVTCWRRLAETVNQYLEPGRQVMVTGEVEVEAYTDRSGQPAATLKLTAREVKFLGSRSDAGGGQGGYSGGQGSRYDDDFAPPQQNISDGDIPF